VPPVVVEQPVPVVSETVVGRRPLSVSPPPVVVDEYPVYTTPRVYAAPPLYGVRRSGLADGPSDITSAEVGRVAIYRAKGRGVAPFCYRCPGIAVSSRDVSMRQNEYAAISFDCLNNPRLKIGLCFRRFPTAHVPCSPGEPRS
jgi:hypothetical protein